MKKSFSISPRILFHLGEDLIKNESIALLELVKNSYDACATKCIINFISENNILSKITIEDDGFGMSGETIENVYLTIGTDFKFKKIEPNICERIPLGEKGIGRLGIHKLGHNIRLHSKAKDSKEVQLTIDWKELLGAEKIDDFKIDIIEKEVPEIFGENTGTLIVVEGLKTKWDKRELREVYRNLTSLNSPFLENNETFKVEIKSNSNLFEGLPNFEDIRNSALYFGHCKMVGSEITEFNYQFKPWETLDKIDSGRVKEIENLLEQEIHIIDENGAEINLDDLEIGSIEFDIMIFEMDSSIFSFSNTEKASIKKYLKENGGIRVYRDGVRVYDYGEKDNDWLGLDLKRISRFGGNVSNNMIIGSVRLNRLESKGLREKSNREGFIEGEAYHTFQMAVNYALALIVRERNVDKNILTTLYKVNKAVEPVLSDLNDVVEYVKEKVEEPVVKDEILKYLYRINLQYVEVKEVLIKSANAGLNLSVVIHEIEKLIAELTGCIERNEKEKAVNISLMLEKIIHGYSQMIKKSEIRFSTLSKIVDIALDNFVFRFRDHRINVISNFRDNELQAFLSEAESISILTNLLDNAIYWLCYVRKENRTISVYITDQIRGFNSIIVSDNGSGFNIPPDIAIKPFITGKPHNIGSGLGLHVANEMMKAMKGQLQFLEKNDINLPSIVTENQADRAIVALCFPKEK
jgi:Histidine kinase-, DNA gyrase B-, and HSP90-like ATPase